MWARITRAIRNKLGAERKPLALPMWMQARMTSLGMIARKGGPGSDLAAAELKGMQTVILAVRRAS